MKEMGNELKILLEINDKLIAEEIQRVLEESGIYSILESDNPASSVLGVYFGPNINENISLMVNQDDYQNAINVISNTPYKDLLMEG
jgi:hypothetical protein